MRTILLAALFLLGCPRASGPPVFDTLVGVEAPLIPGPGLRVAMPGQIFETPAEILVDVAATMTLVTKACIEAPMISSTRVKVVDPLGGETTYPVTRLVGLTVAGRRLTPLEAGLADGQGCVVVLGTDVMAGAALQIDPAKRVVRFVPTSPRAEWIASAERLGGEVQVLELTKDPLHDWPLLAARLTQGQATYTGPFLLSTHERSSRVFETPLASAGFSSTGDLLQKLELPKDVQLPMDLSAFQGIAMDKVEFTPGVGTQSVTFSVASGAAPNGVAGVLAADTWGRFEVTLDVTSGVLMLHRPRVLSAGDRHRCARGQEAPTEDACFQLEQVRAGRGVAVTATIWRPLPEGGRLYLDFPGLSPACRIGFTFDSGDRGRNTQHEVPWSRLFETMKPCAETLGAAKEVSLALFEDTPLRECPGVCAFAQDLRSGRVSCECQPGPLGLSPEAEKLLLEKLRTLLKPKPLESQQEPADPDPSK